MCGIAGSFVYAERAGRDGPSARIDATRLERMRDRMAARGPDGAGLWLSPDGRVGLAHRRLAIIDLSDAGAQPMHYSNDAGVGTDGAANELSIVFNGEIYNHRELRAGLEARGRVFRSGSDTEVLLQLYAEHGEAILPELRGMFAFALWDGRRQRLLLARDTFGIKPLYTADVGGQLHFASQVNSLREVVTDTRPDAAGAAGFLLWGSVPEPWTFVRGIRALPAGHFQVIERGRIGAAQPFLTVARLLHDAAQQPAECSRTEALARVAAAVHDSVAAHHVADVPVGVFLSAGLDSAMLALASAGRQAEQGGKLRTLTLGFTEFADTAQDETVLAADVAALAGADAHTEWVQRQDFQAGATSLFAAMDQPSIDGVNTWFVARTARSAGLKVALSGLGGDELFASYPSFRQVPRLATVVRRLPLARPLGAVARRIVAAPLGRWSSPKYASLLEYGGTLGGAYLLRRALFTPWELPAILGTDLAREGLAELDTLARLDASIEGITSPRLAVSALEMQWYMRNQLLRDADWAGMAHSLEVRVPFVDVTLLRATAPLFARHPDISKAEVARAVAPALPARVLNRPKSGFVVPVRDWLAPPANGLRARGLRDWARFCAARYSSDAMIGGAGGSE